VRPPPETLALATPDLAGQAGLQETCNLPSNACQKRRAHAHCFQRPCRDWYGHATTKLEVAGTVSATTLQLADNPANPCNTANKGMAKVINGRIYVCRYP